MKALYQNMFAVLEAIEDCLEKNRPLPALVLLYSAIDAVASLERKSGEPTGAAFTRWVATYMLKAMPLPCTSLELYAARCGIVHNFAAESDLYRKGQVRCILYAWGTARAENLQETANALHRIDSVSVHVKDLIKAFRTGLATYLEEVGADTLQEERIARRLSIWLINMRPESVTEFLDRYGAIIKGPS